MMQRADNILDASALLRRAQDAPDGYRSPADLRRRVRAAAPGGSLLYELHSHPRRLLIALALGREFALVGTAVVAIRFFRNRSGSSSYEVLDKRGHLHVQ